MSRYAALTAELRKHDESVVTLTFDQIDTIVGGLPQSAHAWGLGGQTVFAAVLIREFGSMLAVEYP